MRKWLLLLLLLSVLGYFGYNLLITKASDMMVEQVTNQIDKKQLNKLLEDPVVKQMIEDVETSTAEDLPFTTKEEAMKTVLKQFSMTEMTDVAAKAQSGELSATEIEAMLEERLTAEEIEALKIIAIKELKARQ